MIVAVEQTPEGDDVDGTAEQFREVVLKVHEIEER